jgi:hypothetical protein
MQSLCSLEELCRKHALDHRQLADKAQLDERRALAILEGRWTPSSAERDRVAAVFGLTREQIAWGHVSQVEHLYGHGPQFGRTP